MPRRGAAPPDPPGQVRALAHALWGEPWRVERRGGTKDAAQRAVIVIGRDSGWRLGDIAATLARAGISAMAESIRPQERVQADLIAMARGYTMTIESSGEPGWLSVTFVRVQDAA